MEAAPTAFGPNGEMGRSVCVVGDVDADGVAEIAAGSPQPTGLPGFVTLASGRTGVVLRTVQGATAGDGFGTSVAPLGDADGDGAGDFAVGAYGPTFVNGVAAGAFVRGVSGATGATLWTLSAATAGGTNSFARRVAAYGDVTGDGVSELVVTDLGGSAYRVNGATGAVLGTVALSSSDTAAGVGDYDGGGTPDFAIMTSGTPNNVVRVFSGSTGGTITSFSGPNADNWGAALAGGDLNGDGRSELLVGAPQGTSPAPSPAGSGYVDVINGVSGFPQRLNGRNAGELFGAAVAYAGDVDAAGSPEFFVGAPGADRVRILDPNYAGPGLDTNAGALYVFTGIPVATAQPETTVWNGDPGDRFGTAVAAGDVNGDGFREAAVGAPYAALAGVGAGSVSTRQGRVQAFSTPDRVLTISPKRVEDRNGQSVWTDALLAAAMADANTILASSGAHVRLATPGGGAPTFVRIVDPSSPHVVAPNPFSPAFGDVTGRSWRDFDLTAPANALDLYENAAQAGPSRTGWEPNAMNVYFVNDILPAGSLGAAGYPQTRTIAFTPDTDAVVVRRNVAAGEYDGYTLVHELGHWLDLFHTHAATEQPAGQTFASQAPLLTGGPGGSGNAVPQWMTADSVTDTVDELTLVPFNGNGVNRAQHDQNWMNQTAGQSAEVVNNVLYNPMSFHSQTPAGAANGPRFTPGQVLRMVRALHRLRGYAVQEPAAPLGVAPPTIATVNGQPIPARIAYAGRNSGPQQIALGGSGLPTALGVATAPVGTPYSPAGLSLGDGSLNAAVQGSGAITDEFSANVVAATGGTATTYQFAGPVDPGVHDVVVWELPFARDRRAAISAPGGLIVTPAVDTRFVTGPARLRVSAYASAPGNVMYLLIDLPTDGPYVLGGEHFTYCWLALQSAVTGSPYQGLIVPLVADAAGNATFDLSLTGFAPGLRFVVQAIEASAGSPWSNAETVIVPQ